MSMCKCLTDHSNEVRCRSADTIDAVCRLPYYGNGFMDDTQFSCLQEGNFTHNWNLNFANLLMLKLLNFNSLQFDSLYDSH